MKGVWNKMAVIKLILEGQLTVLNNTGNVRTT